MNGKKPIAVPYPLVCVEWDDHFSTSGWVSPKSCSKKCRAVSIGFLVNETKENYYLSTTHMAGNVVVDPIAIMKSAVTNFGCLADKPKRKKG